MFLDPSTLQDLDVLPVPQRRGATLWSMVNRTRTRAGGEALRQCLLEPPHTAGDILARQQAHHTLATGTTYRALLDKTDLDSVERYLASTWQHPDEMPALARFKHWYPQYLNDVGQGHRAVAGLLAAADGLRMALTNTDAPVLQAFAGELTTLLDDPRVRVLARATDEESPAALRSFDALARGEEARAVLTNAIRTVANIEASWSLGAITAEHGWSYPTPCRRLRVAGLVHPFLGARAVPNDLHLDDRVRVCFVTGPNMAGKSTFLKAVALAMLLAHAGCGVPAASMEFPVVTTVFSSVNVRDDVGAGESFYLAEVRRIGALATALCEHGAAVAIIDEPFRGTNVHDAAEATLATITRLANHPAALVFVASHVGEVVPAIADNPAVALLHFAADITPAQPVFDYRLREGVSTQRLGMLLLEQEGVLALLDRASGFSKPL